MSEGLWEAWVKSFCLSLERRGCAASTLRRVPCSLGRWVQFCRVRQLEPGQVTRAHLEDFQQDLKWQRGERGPLSASTMAGACAWCRQLLRWAHRQRLLWHDPCQGWELRATPPTELELPEPAQLTTLLAIPDDSPVGLRDRAIMEILYGCALRSSECQSLDLADLHLGERRLHIRCGKGGRPRLLPVGEHLATVLLRYLEEGRPLLQPRHGVTAIFVSLQGHRLSASGYRKLLQRALRQAGIDQRVTLHTLRHACATHLLQGGAPVEAVAALLGHACLTSTQRYTHLNPQALSQEHRRAHPRKTPKEDRHDLA